MPTSNILAGFKCKGCCLRQYANTIVPGRGTWPAAVLFIGEAPGKTEDCLGEAFVGPSGRLLQRAFKDAVAMGGAPVPTFYITNVVACRPTDFIDGPNREPTSEEAIACWPRLEYTVRRVHPQQVVFLGKVAEKHLKRLFPAAHVLVHPAYVLRLGGVTSSVYRAFVRGLSVVFQQAAKEKSRGH